MLALLAGLALGHGGVPTTTEVLFGADGDLTLVTSHGLLAEDEGWAWICEEITGEEALSTGLARTPTRWVMATTSGLIESERGCDWDALAGPTGLTTGIFRDVDEEHVLWAGTSEGLWRSEGGAFSLEQPVDFSLRDAAQLPEGGFALLGFDGDAPVLELDGVLHALPLSSGSMSLLHIDEQARAYVKVPQGSASSLIRVDADGPVVLLEESDTIADVEVTHDVLYVVHYLLGTRWSEDDGATFEGPAGPRLECLEAREDGLYGCPADDSGVALAITTTEALAPDAWNWVEVVRFDEATPADCTADSDAAQTCDDLWPVVASEFGLDVDDPVADTAACGCSQTNAPSAFWVVALGLLRRRPSRKDPARR
ncbi:MAG: hypothetical protein KC912_17645 [Proteobacteria bacterium]|nr:hypothetical protein [Pseudomonadota bacterium]